MVAQLCRSSAGRTSLLFLFLVGGFLSGNESVDAQSNVKPSVSRGTASGQSARPSSTGGSFRIDCILLRQLQSPLFSQLCTGNPQINPQNPVEPQPTGDPDPIRPPDTAGLPSEPEGGEDAGQPANPSDGIDRPATPSTSRDPDQPDVAPGNQPAQPQLPQAAGPLAVPGAPRVASEVVVRIQQALPQAAAAALAQDYNITLVESSPIGLINATVVRYRIPDNRTIETVLVALLADARVEAAQPNYLYFLQQDTRAGKAAALQYALGKLAIPAAHEYATGQGVSIALIDSGVDVSHPELAGARIDIKNAASDVPFATGKHGTALAGVLVAQDKLLGVAPGSRLLAVRAFYRGADGSQETTSLVLSQAMDWSVTQGARIVNMSFAGPDDPLFGAVIEAAADKGVFLVAAAGNEGAKAPKAYPAAHERVAAITATDSQNVIYEQANQGDHIDVAAPGVDILVPAAGSGYEMISGTSLSAAYISGIYALMLEHDKGSESGDPIAILRKTARDLGLPGVDPAFGAGIVDAARAVQSVRGQ
ncbi:MAG: S8 family serine peptidase [Stappiaceae bacterium]